LLQEVVLPKDVIMPALELAQDTGRVVQWLKADGDFVRQGEIVVEIETDKATVELEAEASGYLSDISAEVGADVPVGTVIAKILAEDEIKHAAPSVPESAPESSSIATAAEKESEAHERGTDAATSVAGNVLQGGDSAERNAASTNESRLPSSPKARRLAAERGIDLSNLSIAAGRPVVASDLHQAEGRSASSGEKQEMNRTWRIMAERLTGAWTSIPHFYLSREVDATRLAALKRTGQTSTESKVTISDLLVHSVANCLRDHPRLRTLWQKDGPYASSDINIGLAVGSDEGLIVPVIHRADCMSLLEIADARTELVRRAQSGKPRPEDLAGGTFTISNLGMYGVDSFQAIVNPPQAAILAVGRIVERVVAVSGNPTVRPAMTLTLSCDHRLVDGLRAARFMSDLVNALEGPT
jgi:pyruvate dehydrogenase E2 component (dihydrolipoamide acetyltransferase)